MSFSGCLISFRFLAEDMEDIREIFSNVSNRDDMFSTGLAKIRISMPNSHNQSDVVSYVAEVLHANGIELVNAFFSQDSIVVILNERIHQGHTIYCIQIL